MVMTHLIEISGLFAFGWTTGQSPAPVLR